MSDWYEERVKKDNQHAMEIIQNMVEAVLSGLPNDFVYKNYVLHEILNSGLKARISVLQNMCEENREPQVNEDGEVEGGPEVVEWLDQKIAVLNAIKEQVDSIYYADVRREVVRR